MERLDGRRGTAIRLWLDCLGTSTRGLGLGIRVTGTDVGYSGPWLAIQKIIHPHQFEELGDTRNFLLFLGCRAMLSQAAQQTLDGPDSRADSLVRIYCPRHTDVRE